MKTKTIAALLALLCLSSTLIGCASENAATKDTAGDTADATQSSATDDTPKTNAELIRQRYAGKSFDGAEITIASVSPGQFPYQRRADLNEIFFESESGEVMNDAVYKRNALTEELLNIDIKPLYLGSAPELVTAATNSIQAADDSFDLMINRLDYTMNMASQKLLIDVNSLDVLDTDESWWNRRLVDNFTINGKLYPIAGDLNFFDDFATCMMVFNCRLADNYGVDNLYERVKDGTWTSDYFRETALNATVDLNGDGKLDTTNDQYGYATDHAGLVYEVYNAGLGLSELDSSGNRTISYNEKLVSVIEKGFDFLVTSGKCNVGDTYGDIFADNRKLYFYLNLSSLERLRDMTDDFGALPAPKYDEATEDYTAYISNGTTTAFSIPITNNEATDAAIILDVMSAMSSDTVRTALYDYMLTEKLLRNEESIEMLNTYILGSGQYNLAGDLKWAEDLRNIYVSTLRSKSNNFVSSFEATVESARTSLDNFLAAFN